METVTPSNLGSRNSLRDYFTGRTEELVQVQEALTHNRVVAITGPFGSGKTALALMAADGLRLTFPGGIAIQSLSRSRDGREMVTAAFPAIPNQAALLILDDYVEDYSPGGQPVRLVVERALQEHRWLSMLLLGPVLPCVKGVVQISLGGFSYSDAMAFAQRVAVKSGRNVPLADLALLIGTTRGFPRLLARALELVVEANASVPEVVRQFQNFSYSGLVDVYGNPLGAGVPARRRVVEDVRSVNYHILEMAKEDPTMMRQISPRKFEELVADLLFRQGYDVQLTPPTKDGGFDIFAAQKSALGKFLFLVECKKYDETNRVGVEIVRALHGVVQQHQATAGIVATTSFFTSGAREFQRRIEHQMSLRDYFDIQNWLTNHL